MPIRFRWTSKEYMPIALMLFGACGIFQVLFIFLAQFILGVGNYIVVILIPVGTTIALFFGVVIIFESFVQVEKRKKMRSQFQKTRQGLSKFRTILYFPIIRPIIIVFPVFAIIFFSTYGISLIFLDNVIAFLIAENLAVLISLLIANIIEKKYARINRY
ncbi:MAG: hypothetical protein E3J90_05660 [Promethearchaeota archaeon]|nr:MAG: hypothetical protein E3J90_05660 [Candidatus Lokiarchaeota archaeon]